MKWKGSQGGRDDVGLLHSLSSGLAETEMVVDLPAERRLTDEPPGSLSQGL